jgi:hypothetical protein
MPGPAVHYLVNRQFSERLQGSSTAAVRDDGDTMANFPAAAALGSMGPDFLFFNTRDLSGPVADAVHTYIEVANFIEDFSQQLEELIPAPIMDALEAVEDLASNSVLFNEVSALVSEMQAVMDVLLATGQTFLISLADDTVDVFGLFKHPIQDNVPKNEWWWFDTLHYARTGRYAQALLQDSAAGTLERAYALGYLTHVAADTVGHPYVNMIVGGPFRTYGQRHKVVENFQDTWAWNHYRNTEFTRSALHTQFLLSGTPRMPTPLARFIVRNMENVYGNSFAATPSTNDVQDAYRLWYEWFRSTTETGMPPEPWTYSLSAELQEAWDQFKNNAGSIIDGYTDAVNAAGGAFSLFGLLAALVGLIVAGLLMAAALLDFIAGSLLTLGAAPVRALLAIVYQTLYSVYKQIRFATSLKGLAFPLREDLTRPEVAHAIHPQLPDIIGNTASSTQAQYPRLAFTLPAPLNLEDHLFHPAFIPAELISTTGAPDPYYKMSPDYYIDGPVSLIPPWLTVLQQGIQVAAAQQNSFRTESRRERLGNAVALSEALYQGDRAGRRVPDLNLDGDRGIGWPCNEIVHPVTNPVSSTDLQ